MRKWLAGRLIRLAHRIYPPKVTATPEPAGLSDFIDGLYVGADAYRTRTMQARRESRGWDN